MIPKGMQRLSDQIMGKRKRMIADLIMRQTKED
jgi:hypothetical protein